MILDQFTLHSVIIQTVYEDAFILWDRAGDIARRMSKIWPGLKLVEGQPNQQTLTAPGVQILTGFRTSTFTMRGPKALDQTRVRQITDSYSLLRDSLELENLQRVSARSVYVKKFQNLKEANNAVAALGLLKWPSERVFDQPTDTDMNGAEILFRFEDKTSFTFLRLKAEELKFEAELDPEFFDEPIKRSEPRMVIDFDRGLLGTIDARKLRMDDWLKGYSHVLRRDIDKVLRPNT
ncbi:hypothetical protein PTKU64_21900 [Paraburkholderia terrae]|uniref:TIGR04255 family protein n=1 Tax=Paraburkholderia terrae TaxID=311230 RepID=A0ABM7THS2_9BURK|nr:hypothetical protein [Paraburkholderia terrae]BCZ78515.1 hypothetical protein PTKU64_21900 [Paraburkholderia terrae]